MTTLSEAEFSARAELTDWRVVHAGAAARFRAGSLREAAAFGAAVADAVRDAAVAVDLDVRAEGVVVRLPVRRDAAMTEEHGRVARIVSDVASRLGLEPDPDGVRTVQLALDAVDVPAVTAFWSAALGYEPQGHHLYDPQRTAPTLFVQDKAWRTPRNRFHVDVSLPHDRAEDRVDEILRAGGRLLGDRYAPSWWSLVDPEGNVVDVATWQEREGS